METEILSVQGELVYIMTEITTQGADTEKPNNMNKHLNSFTSQFHQRNTATIIFNHVHPPVHCEGYRWS